MDASSDYLLRCYACVRYITYRGRAPRSLPAALRSRIDAISSTLNWEIKNQMKRKHCIAVIVTVLLAQTIAPAGQNNAIPPPKIFEPAQVQAVYRILLDRDALLLESILDVIKQKNIQDGYVMVGSGSVQSCTYHYVTSTALKPVNAFKTVKGPFEILNAGGIIAAGEPHVHITLSSPEKGAFGGHLEKGCRVLYLAEVTILQFRGPALTRANNQNGVSMLQPK
jgi:uncharacterized protein